MRLLSQRVGFGKTDFFVLFKKSYIFWVACAKGTPVTKPPKPHWVAQLLTHRVKLHPILDPLGEPPNPLG